MKKINIARIVVLVLSIALLIGAAMSVTVAAEDDTTGEFGGITVAYGDKVAIRVAVNATEEQIKNGDVVVSYTLNEETKTAKHHETDADGTVWVITEGIAAFDLAQEVTFSSTANGAEVESGRTYSVAQFLYKMLYTNSDLSENYRNLYNSLLAYGEAAQIALNKNADNLVTESTLVTAGENITLNGCSYAFAPAANLSVTPVYTAIPAGYEVIGWTILDNGERKVVEDTTIACAGLVEIVSPLLYSPYYVTNGDFETGDLTGWTLDGAIGYVSAEDVFWKNADKSYNKQGDYLFSGVEDVNGSMEAARGTLTSSEFTVGGTGHISFMLGGGENVLCYVQVIDADGNVVARYHQQALNEGVLVQYVAKLPESIMGEKVRIQVVDQADRSWGCVSFDNVVTYYASEADLPEGITATDIKDTITYDITNGSFETGDLTGWSMNITEAGAHNTLGWVLKEEDNQEWYANNEATKDGDFLFTFLKPVDVNCEKSMGTLTSSTFTLKHDAYVSFKFGGAGGGVNHNVYIELCRADGTVIATFYNDAEGKTHTLMNSYYYQYQGGDVECFFRVVDNSTGDYGCFVIDAFQVNLEAAPEGYIAAILK